MLTSQGAGAYTFRHIVIREVAYATLPRIERVRAHLLLADWLERDSQARANELAELIAYHYRQAVALSPGHRVPEGVEAARIVAALERAARIASQVGAFGEVRELLSEAISIATESEYLRLYELLGDETGFGDPAIDAYATALERWRGDPRADPAVGARLAVKRFGVIGRWSGSITRTYSAEEVDGLIADAHALVARAADPVLEAHLVCAEIFPFVQRQTTRTVTAESVADYERRAIAARRLFAQRGDQNALSAALDALGAVYRDGYGDAARAVACDRERITELSDAWLLERIDAWSMLVWDLTYVGDYVAAERVLGEATAARRPGEPDFMLAHAASWSGFAAMLAGHWEATIAAADRLLEMREEGPLGRYTFPGWVAGMRVARARLDDTRLARYRAAFTAIADIDNMRPELRDQWTPFLDLDAARARAFLARREGGRDRKSELLMLILFESGERVADEELDALATRAAGTDAPLIGLRIALARALNAGDAELRGAIAALDEGGLVADAARATALLALRTRKMDDRADAERRLSALGDQRYLQLLAEEW